MCGRFGLFARLDAIEDYFDTEFTFDYEPRYNIAPEGPGIASIRNESPGEVDQLRWGLIPHWVDDPDEFPMLINARAETAAEKPAFRDAFEKRRCLIPANNFYEWTDWKGSRRPHSIGLKDRELFAMAGLWETWSANGEEIRSVTILTTDANDVVSKLHDRMPVILERDEEDAWLTADDTDELRAILDPYPSDRTTSYEVSRQVNNPANDGSRLVEPVGSDQTGLGDFA